MTTSELPGKPNGPAAAAFLAAGIGAFVLGLTVTLGSAFPIGTFAYLLSSVGSLFGGGGGASACGLC